MLTEGKIMVIILFKLHEGKLGSKPYHPRGRGKIERYDGVLWRELITQVRFSSLSHFKSELRKFDRKYYRRESGIGMEDARIGVR